MKVRKVPIQLHDRMWLYWSDYQERKFQNQKEGRNHNHVICTFSKSMDCITLSSPFTTPPICFDSWMNTETHNALQVNHPSLPQVHVFSHRTNQRTSFYGTILLVRYQYYTAKDGQNTINITAYVHSWVQHLVGAVHYDNWVWWLLTQH